MSFWKSLGRELSDFGIISMLMGAISVFGLGAAFLSAKQSDDLIGLSRTKDSLTQALHKETLDALQLKISKLERDVRRPSSGALPVPTRADIAGLTKKVDELGSRQAKLESTLTDQPLKALEIPMMRKDVEAQAKEITALTAALQRAQDSQWETMKWLIGGLGAGFAALFLPLVARFINKRSANNP